MATRMEMDFGVIYITNCSVMNQGDVHTELNDVVMNILCTRPAVIYYFSGIDILSSTSDSLLLYISIAIGIFALYICVHYIKLTSLKPVLAIKNASNVIRYSIFAVKFQLSANIRR